MRLRHPSPSTVLSLLALFVALGGSSYAAVKAAKNSVDSRAIRTNAVGSTEIKRNAVGSSEIKRNAVGSSEIRAGGVSASEVKNNGLGGDDIDESKLGTVPTATAAGTAAKATEAERAAVAASAGNADKLDGREASGFVTSDRMITFGHKMNAGEKRTLAAVGSLSLEAECVDNGTVNGSANQDGVIIRIATSKNGATFVSNEDTLDGGANPADFLNTDTAADDREFYVFGAANGTVDQAQVIDELSAIDPDGHAFTTGGGESFAASVNHAGAACFVGGLVFPLS